MKRSIVKRLEKLEAKRALVAAKRSNTSELATSVAAFAAHDERARLGQGLPAKDARLEGLSGEQLQKKRGQIYGGPGMRNWMYSVQEKLEYGVTKREDWPEHKKDFYDEVVEFYADGNSKPFR